MSYTENTKITISLTVEQRNKLENLRSTTMSGERSDSPKSLEEMIYQAVEKGLYAIIYSRKQYVEKQMGKRLMKAIKDEKFRGEQAEAMTALLESVGLTRKGTGNGGINKDANEEREHRG